MQSVHTREVLKTGDQITRATAWAIPKLPRCALLMMIVMLAACGRRDGEQTGTQPDAAVEAAPVPAGQVAPAPPDKPSPQQGLHAATRNLTPDPLESARLADEYRGQDLAELQRMRALAAKGQPGSAYEASKLFLEAYPESQYKEQAMEILADCQRRLDAER